MYQVNREKISGILKNMNSTTAIIKPFTSLSQEEFVQDQIIILAAERALHISMEAILDVGNLIIDGFIMRDPGSYVDIIEILRDEQVLPEESAVILKEFIAFRKILVQDYTETNPEEVYSYMLNSLPVIDQFETHINNYLDKELGDN